MSDDYEVRPFDMAIAMMHNEGNDPDFHEWVAHFAAWHHDVMIEVFDLMHDALLTGRMGVVANATAFVNQTIGTTIRFHYDLLTAYGEAVAPDLTATDFVQSLVHASEQAFNDELVAAMTKLGWRDEWVAFVPDERMGGG